jgi:hypothetical protein
MYGSVGIGVGALLGQGMKRAGKGLGKGLGSLAEKFLKIEPDMKFGARFEQDVSTPGQFMDALLFRGARKTSPGPSAAEAARRAGETQQQTSQRIFGTRFQDNPARQAEDSARVGNTVGSTRYGQAARTKNNQALKDAQQTVKQKRKNLRKARAGASPHLGDKDPAVKKAKDALSEAERKHSSLKSNKKADNSHKTETENLGKARGTAERNQAERNASFQDALRVEDNYSDKGRPMGGIPNWIINHPKTMFAGMALASGSGAIDSAAGYAQGGPGYGGAIGFGEGFTSSRQNVFQGANVNMNFQAQTMAYQELVAGSVLPQTSMGTAPMMSRRMGRQFQNSAQGLTLGLHKARHGGY